MTTLRLLLGDQLSHSISSLQGSDIQKDVVLMCELRSETRYVKHHKKKIAFIFSAMRHFAQSLEDGGYRVEYVRFDDPMNTGTFRSEVARVINKYQAELIVVTCPGEFRLLADIQDWSQSLGVDVELRQDDRFLCSMDEFFAWAKNRKQLRMEFFYRQMRSKYAVLMDGDSPEGGKWNFDAKNRKPPKNGLIVPEPTTFKVDSITQDVLKLIAEHFPDHFGDLEPFYFAVTREHALKVLDDFIKQRLPDFGDYQDAMLQDEPWMFHSHISFYLNCGLLLPMECIQEAEQAFRRKEAPLHAVEGFIRQILGWREFVRGIYWLKMPEYAQENFLEAQNPLPDFYWTAQTKMNCLKQCVKETKQNAYAHHIQRLMVLGNFALLAGVDPQQVNEWFLIVYADAYEWVELPNVSGMILFADGGYLASKPYAAGGSYINKMSNYCSHCSYEVNTKNGPSACPFNYLYWDFLSRNRQKLASNPRIAMMYKTLDRMEGIKKDQIQDDSDSFMRRLQSGCEV